MPYSIHYHKAGSETGVEHWTGKLETAMGLAKSAVASGIADRVEVYNDAEQMVGHHPRVMRKGG